MRRRTLVALALVSWACSHDPGGPGPVIVAGLSQPATLETGVMALESVFTSTSFHSFAALGPLFQIPGAPMSLRAAAPAACAPVSAVTAATFAGSIPDSVVRHVFYYEPSVSSYLPSADTSGPARGVRFLLYEVDSIGRPATPLLGAGYFDLTDETTGAGLALRGMMAGSAGAAAQYTLNFSGPRDAYRVQVAGTVTNGASTATVTDSTTRDFAQLTRRATVRDSARRTTYRLEAAKTLVDPFDSFYDVAFTVTNDVDSVRVSGSITTYCLIPSTSLTITVRGTDYAEVRSGMNGPVIVRLDHEVLDGAEATALWSVIRLQGELFEWLQTLITPAQQLLAP